MKTIEITAEPIKMSISDVKLYLKSENKTMANFYFNVYGFELSDCYSNSYVKYIRKSGEVEFLPLGMFIKTDRENNFTHGIYSISYFDGYFLTLSRDNSEAVVAHKHF